MNAAVKRAAFFLLLACTHACAPAGAQALQDPTRPPASLIVHPEGAAGTAAAAPEQRAPRLQSVLIGRGPGGRHIAIIDGETLRPGDLYKGARVTRIEPNAVELRRGRTRQVLTLDAPDVPKRMTDKD